MDSFDKFIKENIKDNKFDVPDNFNKKIDDILSSLPEEKEKSNMKPKPLIKIVAASLAFCLLGVIAIKTPIVKATVLNVISYFTVKTDSTFIGDKAIAEKFNKAVGASVEDKGIKVTLDNILSDDNFLMCYYTITSKNPIKYNEVDASDKAFKDFFLTPFFNYKINNKQVESLNNNNQESYLVNDNTLKVVTRANISANKIPNKFNIEISTDEIFKTKGSWSLKTSLDKDDIAKETKTVKPNLKASLDFGLYKKDIKINKVSLSPLGNQINIDSDNPFGNFALIDPSGNYLDVLNTDSRDGNNSYEFLKANKDMEFIELIPIKASNERDLNIEVFANINKENIILQANAKGKVIVENINFSKDKIVIKYKHEGLVNHLGDFSFEDKTGNSVDLGRCAAFYSVDRSTNTYTTTYVLYNSQTNYSKIAKIGTLLPKDIVLMDHSKVRIPLK